YILTLDYRFPREAQGVRYSLHLFSEPLRVAAVGLDHRFVSLREIDGYEVRSLDAPVHGVDRILHDLVQVYRAVNAPGYRAQYLLVPLFLRQLAELLLYVLLRF